LTVAVVILNWNGKALLEKFLPSVVKYSKEAEIYVADNASTDNSVEFLQNQYPHVKILRNTENGGYAKGYNDALKNVSEDIYVLLNSDVEVTQNWLKPLMETFRKKDTIFAAQPRLLDYNNKEYFEYAGAAGGFLDRFGYPFCRGRIFSTVEKDTGQYEEATSIFWASGACLFVRREAFWKAAGFDEDLFAHQEEIDLCWRLQAIGGEIYYVPDSEVYHVGGATLHKSHPRKTFYNFRNSLLLLVKHVNRNQMWWVLLVRLLLDGIAAVQFLASGKLSHFTALFRAHLSFYSLVPKFLKKRKHIPKTVDYKRINSIVWHYYVKGRRRFNELY